MNDPWWLAGGVSPANCVAAYQPIGAPSLETSYINLVNPDQGTYNARPGVAPTFGASTGWTFNGSTQYLTTRIYPGKNMQWGIALRGSGSGWAIGGEWERFGIIFSDATRLMIVNNGIRQTRNAVPFAGGTLIMTGTALYENNVEVFSQTGSGSDGDETQEICIGRFNNISNYLNGNIKCISFYNRRLTVAQAAALHEAMNALTGASLPTYQMPSAGMRRWAKLYSQQVGTAFIPAWARHSNRIITPGVMLP